MVQAVDQKGVQGDSVRFKGGLEPALAELPKPRVYALRSFVIDLFLTCGPATLLPVSLNTSMLSPDFRHYVKIADLDTLESMARQEDDSFEVAHSYEVIFDALDRRKSIDDKVTSAWGERYIAWTTSFVERDGFPMYNTAWARRMLEIALLQGAVELAKTTIDVVLQSYAPDEKERIWWQKQRYRLAQKIID